MNRRIRKLLLAVAMTLTVLPIFKSSIIKVEAKTTYTYYSFACPAYEVDTISDSGEFVLSSCQSSFDAAKSAMYAAGNDAVVRDRNAYSANQIIAMTRGYAYSYSVRAGRYTLIIRQNASGSDVKSTYINNLRAMLYEGTPSYNGDGTGSVLVNAYGFEGLADLIQVDLVPSKFVDLGLPIWMGGNDVTPNPDHEWQVIPRRPYYTAEQNGNYTDLVYYCYSSVPDSSGVACDISNNGLHVGVAPSWMEQGKKFYSWNDTDFYSDPECKNYVNTYYNYYQFVPYHTKSKIASSVYNSFLSNAGRNSSSKLWNMGDRFISDQESYGINAAMVFVQACDESAYGTSNYALNRNNLFGVAAYDSNPDNATDFDSPEAAIDYQMSILLKNYCNTSYSLYFGDHFGNKGSGITVKYASSNYYGLVLASMYYNFDKFANSYSGALTDYQSSCVGVIKDQNTNIYSTPNGSVMFTTEYGSTYQKDNTVSILGEVGDYYKVQSTDYIENGQQMDLQWADVRTYSWPNMVGYIKKSDIKTIIGTVPDSSKAQAFITALYKAALDRAPDDSGMNYWLYQLMSGASTGSNAAYNFIFGSEFTSKNYCNKHFVDHLYLAFFGRNADDSGLNYWTGQLDAGMTREQVFNSFVESSEFANLCAEAGIQKGSEISVSGSGTKPTGPCPLDSNSGSSSSGSSTRDFVLRMYTKCLGRDAETQGADYWTNQLTNGYIGGTYVAEYFFFSAEFTSHNFDNTEFIKRLYRTVFGREADSSGLAYWVDTLNHGVNKNSVLQGFSDSAEWSNICSSYGIKK